MFPTVRNSLDGTARQSGQSERVKGDVEQEKCPEGRTQWRGDLYRPYLHCALITTDAV